MALCPNCAVDNEAGASVCAHCGHALKGTSWWSRLLAALTGESAPAGPPAPPPPAIRMASGEPERLSLFEEWLNYGVGRGEGFVIFESEKGGYVQFAFGPQGSGTHAEIGTSTWKEVFGATMPESVGERLVQKGFQPPERNDVNHWQTLEEDDARSLAALTEWAFREVFAEDRIFTAKVADFE